MKSCDGPINAELSRTPTELPGHCIASSGFHLSPTLIMLLTIGLVVLAACCVYGINAWLGSRKRRRW